MDTYLKTLRLLNRDGRMLLLSHFCVGVGYPGIYVVLFNLYLARLGYGTEFIGLTNGIAIFTHAFLCLPAGRLGKSWGVRRCVVTGAFATGTGLALIPLAGYLPNGWQASWIVAAYTLAWASVSLYLVNHTPFLIAVTVLEARNHVFSLLIAFLATATFLGSLVGGLLPGLFASLTGLTTAYPEVYRDSLFVAAAIFLLSVPALLRTREIVYEQHDLTGAVASQAPVGFIALMAMVMLLRVSTEGAGKTFFNVYLDSVLHIPTATIGTLMAFGQLLAIPAALLMPLLARRWGRARTVIFALGGMAVGMIPLALIPHWSAAGLGYMTMIGLAAMANPAFVVYSQESVPQIWRSTMAGTLSMASGFGQAWTAIGGGYIIAGLGFASLHGLGAFLAASGALLFAAYLYLSARRTALV